MQTAASVYARPSRYIFITNIVEHDVQRLRGFLLYNQRRKMAIPTAQLNNGKTIPLLGYGTWVGDQSQGLLHFQTTLFSLSRHQVLHTSHLLRKLSSKDTDTSIREFLLYSFLSFLTRLVLHFTATKRKLDKQSASQASHVRNSSSLPKSGSQN